MELSDKLFEEAAKYEDDSEEQQVIMECVLVLDDYKEDIEKARLYFATRLENYLVRFNAGNNPPIVGIMIDRLTKSLNLLDEYSSKK